MRRPPAVLRVAAALALTAACGPVTGSGELPVGSACAQTAECVPGAVCHSGYCVGDGVLRVTLTWSSAADFDLHLRTPGGAEIFWDHRSAEGGTLDLDQCVTGCAEGPHVENIVFRESAPAGRYEVWVEQFSGEAGGLFTIEVQGAVRQTFTGTLAAEAGATSQLFSFSR